MPPCNASNRIGNALPVAKCALSDQGNECVAHFLDTESLNQLAKLFLNLACHWREQFGGNRFSFFLPSAPAVGPDLHSSFLIHARLFDASHISWQKHVGCQ